jgi:hypothetical protein
MFNCYPRWLRWRGFIKSYSLWANGPAIRSRNRSSTNGSDWAFLPVHFD